MIGRPHRSLLSARRPALVVGHPGHELLVHGWLERARPLVFVLTDGSGSEGQSRLASTTRVLDDVGAPRGAIYGDASDRELYTLMIEGRLDRFTALFTTLAGALLAHEIDCVVGDAAEGHNPTHDVCRLLVNAAVAHAARAGLVVENFEFPQVGRPDASQLGDAAGREAITLDDPALQRKLGAAAGYPEMAAEVERALVAYGVAWCRTEWFARASADPTAAHATLAPYYETYGAKRVAEGRYPRVLRYAEHVAPVRAHLHALANGASTTPPCSADTRVASSTERWRCGSC